MAKHTTLAPGRVRDINFEKIDIVCEGQSVRRTPLEKTDDMIGTSEPCAANHTTLAPGTANGRLGLD